MYDSHTISDNIRMHINKFFPPHCSVLVSKDIDKSSDAKYIRTQALKNLAQYFNPYSAQLQVEKSPAKINKTARRDLCIIRIRNYCKFSQTPDVNAASISL